MLAASALVLLVAQQRTGCNVIFQIDIYLSNLQAKSWQSKGQIMYHYVQRYGCVYDDVTADSLPHFTRCNTHPLL